MRISELSRRSETSVSTIKFYIREGLLPPGVSTARNQSNYEERHLERLDLIHRLKTFAGLSIETIGAVLNAAGAEADDYKAMGAGLDATNRVQVGTSPIAAIASAGSSTKGRVMIENLVEARGWELSQGDTTVEDIANALDRIFDGWPFKLPDAVLEKYTKLAFEMVEFEIPDDWQDGLDDDGTLQFALLGTFLFEPLILSVRRLAHRVRIGQSMGRNVE